MAFLDTQDSIRKAGVSSWLQYHLGESPGYHSYQKAAKGVTSQKGRASATGNPKVLNVSSRALSGGQLRPARPSLNKSQSNLELSHINAKKHSRYLSDSDINIRNLWWISKDSKEDNGQSTYKLTHTRPPETAKLAVPEPEVEGSENGDRDSAQVRSAKQRLLGTTRTTHSGLLPLRKPVTPSFKEMRFFDTSAMVKAAPVSNHTCNRYTGRSKFTSTTNGYPMSLRRGTSDLSDMFSSRHGKEYHDITENNRNGKQSESLLTENVRNKRQNITLAFTHTRNRDHSKAQDDFNQCLSNVQAGLEISSVTGSSVTDEVSNIGYSDTPENSTLNKGSERNCVEQNNTGNKNHSQDSSKGSKLAKLEVSDYFCVVVDEQKVLPQTESTQTKNSTQEPVVPVDMEPGSKEITPEEPETSDASGESLSTASIKKRTVRFSVNNEILEYEPWEPLVAEVITEEQVTADIK